MAWLFSCKVGHAACVLAALPAIVLGGCSPIEGWRSVSGANKNDPAPNAPFTGNLADADAAPYPNLASVPPPPSRGTSAAERQKLTQNLIADRTAAAALAGPPIAGPSGLTAAPIPAPARSRTEPASPQAAAASPTAIGTPAAATPPGPTADGASASGTPSAKTALNATNAARTKSGESAEPLPMDSTLQMPQVRAAPEPETPRPALPPPRLAAAPRPVLTPEPPPAAVASAVPQAAPSVPVLAPVAPPPGPPKPEPKRPPAGTTVATLERVDKSQIAQVAGLYKEQPGSVRVVAHAAPPPSGGDPLASYHAALERAQAVAKALAEAGIPANKIQSEATPATAGSSAAARVEIQFLP
jgi:hypothetical protein